MLARAAAYEQHARHDPRRTTRNGRAAFLKRFEPSDPDLSPEEFERRTNAARRAYFTRLSVKAAEARSRRAGTAR